MLTKMHFDRINKSCLLWTLYHIDLGPRKFGLWLRNLLHLPECAEGCENVLTKLSGYQIKKFYRGSRLDVFYYEIFGF